MLSNRSSVNVNASTYHHVLLTISDLGADAELVVQNAVEAAARIEMVEVVAEQSKQQVLSQYQQHFHKCWSYRH